MLTGIHFSQYARTSTSCTDYRSQSILARLVLAAVLLNTKVN